MNEKRRVRPVPKWLERMRNNRARVAFQAFIESVFRTSAMGTSTLEKEAREQAEEWGQRCRQHPPSIQ